MREIGFRYDYTTQLLQYINEHRVSGTWFGGSPTITKSSVIANDIELVLERKRDAMEWTFHFTRILEEFVEIISVFKSFLECDLGQGVGLLQRQRPFEESEFEIPVDARRLPYFC